MASKLVVVLACFALCNANPVFLKGYFFRDGRGYSIGQGYTNNAGGRATGSATINGDVIQAYGSASTDDLNPLTKDIGYGIAYPGEAVAKAEIYDGPASTSFGSAKAVAEAQNTPTYYRVPAPATIISYEQNFETPINYPGNVAQSSATVNDNSESSYTLARADGTGVAESSSNTQGIGSYGITSSNAKTFGSGFGTASSNVRNGYGAATTAAKTQGYGSASSKSQNGLTSAQSQTNGGYASSSANNALDSAVVSTNSQGYGSSNADVSNLQGVVVNTAKGNDLKGIHWQFGTAYSIPTPGQVQVSSQTNGGSAKSTAQTTGALTTADSQGFGSANANSNSNGAYVNSAANTNGISYGAAKNSMGNGFGAANSAVNNGLGNIKSSANSNGYGNANAHADISPQFITSVSNSNGYGSASSSADTAPSYAFLKSEELRNLYSGSRPTVQTQTTGQGSASSSARTQGLNTGYRVVNSAANSFGHGTAQANASA